MKIENLKELFESFLKDYQEEMKNNIWTSQSSRFKEFWDGKIMKSDGQELTDQEIDDIVRILDSHGKGNTKDSEAIAGVLIPQGAWRRMFQQLKKEETLAGCIDQILKTNSSEDRISQIDKLYELNTNKIKFLTGKSGNAINCLLAAYDPFNNLSIVSLKDRYKLLEKLGVENDFTSYSIGNQIEKTNNLIRAIFEESGIYKNSRIISSFVYSPILRGFWKTAEQQKEIKFREPGPDYTLKTRYWIYAPGKNAIYWNLYYEEGLMGLGWNQAGDFRNFTSRESMIEKMKEQINPQRTFSNDSLACWQFYKVIKLGDIIIPKKGTRIYLGYGIVQSDYYYDPNRSDYHHLRKVKWMTKGEWPEDSGPIVLKTLTDITKYPTYVNKLKALLNISELENIESFEPVQPALVATKTGIQYWWMNANPKQWNIDNFREGQVQSYTTHNEAGNKRRIYEYFKMLKPGDLIIGYQSTPSLRVKALFEVTSGINQDEDGNEAMFFKIIEYFPYQALWEELKVNPLLSNCEVFNNNQGSLFKLTESEFSAITETCKKGLNDEPDSYTISEALAEIFFTEDQLRNTLDLLEYKRNLILQGPPGTGKTFIAKRLAYASIGRKDSNKIEMIQFHQSYAYEDFIQGYRPTSDGKFQLQSGLFYDFCIRVQRDVNGK